MGWNRNKRDNRWDVFVYDPARKRNVYVGRRKLEREAKQLYRDKTDEFNTANTSTAWTCDRYADQWLELHHGSGTRRPASRTFAHNEQMLREFRIMFGRRRLDDIKRGEALAWARQHPHNAKVVAAMFNDAIDDEACQANPFRNRRLPEARGRRDIHPLTEDEVARLADVALVQWGKDGYGLVARAWVLFGAWVGTRPGETFSVRWDDLDLANGLVRVTRVKGRKQTDTVVLPSVARDAILDMPASSGVLFRTVTGQRMVKGALAYHWGPIRAAFRQTVTPDRWGELVEGTKNPDLSFYALRHHAASVIVDRGGNEYDVAQQLGNTPDVCREVYIHSYKERINARNRERLEGGIVVDLGKRRRTA
jgi:integrase